VREAEAFRELRPVGNRFVTIVLDAISGKDISKIMLDEHSKFANKVNFFFQSENGRNITLRPELEPRAYKLLVASLAEDLADKLRELKRPKNPLTGKTVLLAPLEPDIDEPDLTEKWNEIYQLLRSDGVTILPKQEYPIDETELNKAIGADVQKADMFVQLLSLEKWDRAKLQFGAAAKAATARDIPILQWRRRINAELLADLPEDDKNLLEGPTVRASSLQELKNEIRERLKQPPPNEPPVGDRPYIYIAANTCDQSVAAQLQDRGRKKADAEVMVGEQRRRNFKEALKRSTGLIFLYGGTKPDFINQWARQYIRDIGDPDIRKMREKRGLDARPKLTVLYRAPPKKEPQEEAQLMIPFEPLTFGSHEKLILEDIERICAELSGERG
jgi:hypothetical protein